MANDRFRVNPPFKSSARWRALAVPMAMVGWDPISPLWMANCAKPPYIHVMPIRV